MRTRLYLDMSHLDDDPDDDDGLSLLKALAWTPEVAPFTGTDRYQVRACLGEGGFGVVYDVEDRETGRRLALKTLKPDRSGFASTIQRLKREFRAVADLVHPNLVGLYELASYGSRWFLTMELVRGCDFLSYVRDETGVSERRLRAALAQLVAGVTALHRAGIIHRDLKPSNVLVEVEGRVVILDFGLADGEQIGDSDLDEAGTPSFVAPEQALGGRVTAAADWYSVGVMLYEALTGALPNPELVLPSRHASVPGDLERLCLALLRREPNERPSAAAIHSMLGHAAPVEQRREPRFVGRTHELAILRDAHSELARGRPTLIRIHGQPGIGKSSLIERFCTEVRDQTVVLAGRCHERETVPFKAFDGVADALVGYLGSLPRHEAAALMPRDIALVTQLFPVFDGVAAVHDVPSPTACAAPRETRLRSFAALKELIGRIADKCRSLVIAIDDLQWGDIDSARLLAHLLAPPRPMLLLLLSYRSAEADTSPALRETLRMIDATGGRDVVLAVEPLPLHEANELAGELLGPTVPSSTARMIAERGEGHPLFMSELARALAHHEHGEEHALGLLDILWRRVQQLSATTRVLLETIAVAGEPLPSALCCAAAGLDDDAVDAIRTLRAEHLIRAADRGDIVVFHDRIRDAIITRSDAETQSQRHLSLARSLETAPDPDLESVARHFGAAGHHEQAARYAMRAVDVAMKALAFDRAAALCRMAIDRDPAGGAAELHERLGDALLHAGNDAASGNAYLAAAARSDGHHATDLRRRAGEHLLGVGDIAAGYDAIGRALADCGERLPANVRQSIREVFRHYPLIKLRGYRFREREASTIPREQLRRLDVLDSAAKGMASADFARALGVILRFIRAALKTGEPRHVATALVWGGAIQEGVERPRKTDELLDRAELIGARFADWNVQAFAMQIRAQSHYTYGQLASAYVLANAAASLIVEHCVDMGESYRFVRMLATMLDTQLGELARAKRQADALLLAAIEREDPVAARLVCVTSLVPLALAHDDVEQARQFQHHTACEDRCAAILFAGCSAAALAMYRGQPREAIEAWRSRYERLDEEMLLRSPAFRLAYVRSLATALFAAADDPREIAKLARSIRRLRFSQARAVHACVRAYVALLDGHRDRGSTLLLEAALHYDETSLVLDAAACRYRAAQLTGGAAAMEAADSVLRARGIVSPERWIAMMVPALAHGAVH